MATPVRLIKDGDEAIKQIMQEALAKMSQGMIEGLVNRAAKLPDSQVLNALKSLAAMGSKAYRDELLTAMSVIASDAIAGARTEIPNAKNVKLSEGDDSIQLAEFDTLPTPLQKKLKKHVELTVDTQIADLEKVISFQYASSIESTDSMALVKQDLLDAADKFISGASIQGGASVGSAMAVNEARKEFFYDDQVADEIEAFEFVNEDPVSPICQDLAGTVFDKNDPNAFRYWAPLHFNCKSWIRPIVNGKLGSKEIQSLKPSKAELDQYVQLAESACVCGLVHFHAA